MNSFFYYIFTHPLRSLLIVYFSLAAIGGIISCVSDPEDHTAPPLAIGNKVGYGGGTSYGSSRSGHYHTNNYQPRLSSGACAIFINNMSRHNRSHYESGIRTAISNTSPRHESRHYEITNSHLRDSIYKKRKYVYEPRYYMTRHKAEILNDVENIQQPVYEHPTDSPANTTEPQTDVPSNVEGE